MSRPVRKIPLIEVWRKVAVSRFAKAMVEEMDRLGGPEKFARLVGTKVPTLGTWVRNTAKPGRACGEKMAAIAPDLKPHLEERGCIGGKQLKNRQYQRRQVPVPLFSAAQTTEVAVREHQKMLTEAKQRALKHARMPRIIKAARKVNARAKARRKQLDQIDAKYGWFNRNPCTHGGAFAVVEGIGSGAANVGVPESFNTED